MRQREREVCGNVRPQLASWYCILSGIILPSLQPHTLSSSTISLQDHRTCSSNNYYTRGLGCTRVSPLTDTTLREWLILGKRDKSSLSIYSVGRLTTDAHWSFSIYILHTRNIGVRFRAGASKTCASCHQRSVWLFGLRCSESSAFSPYVCPRTVHWCLLFH